MKRPTLPALCALCALAALGACEKADNQPGPGGVTVGEARQLDEAAATIESEAPPVLPPLPASPAPAPREAP